MNKMNPVDTATHSTDGASERHRLNLLITVAALALFVGGGMVFYSLSSGPPTTVAADYSRR